MINNLSNRAYGWLCATLIGSVVALSLVISQLQAIIAAWLWIRWILLLIGLILALYALYLLWHQVHTRHLTRSQQKTEIRLLVAGHEDEKWRAEQALLHAQEMERTRVEIERERVRLDQMKAQLEHERLLTVARWQAQHVTVPAGHGLYIREQAGYSMLQAPHVAGMLASGKKQEDETEVVIPQAPKFLDMVHMLTDKKSPLCFGASGPVYGTVDDLLSMAVTGKPGRGKTTALMYYVAILLKAGAEVWVWDPHGAMGELAQLNGKQLSNMPATAKVVYLDRKQDIVASINPLLKEFEARDELYRNGHRVKHPLLLLADEMPVLADWDDELEAEFKATPKQERTEYLAPSLITVIRRMVLEARKWRCFFIGSGQSFDAQILPTRVTENFNSRIVFFSSDRRARMSGLESDAIKTLLPAIRRAGSGVMIFDCSRFDEAIIGALPYIAVEDLLAFLGVVERAGVEPCEGTFTGGSLPSEKDAPPVVDSVSQNVEMDGSQNDTNQPQESEGDAPNMRPMYPMMNEVQAAQFKALYPVVGSIDGCLDKIEGCNHRHRQHARMLIEQFGLKRRA